MAVFMEDFKMLFEECLCCAGYSVLAANGSGRRSIYHRVLYISYACKASDGDDGHSTVALAAPQALIMQLELGSILLTSPAAEVERMIPTS